MGGGRDARSHRSQIVVAAAVTFAVCVALVAAGARQQLASDALPRGASEVLLVGVPGLRLEHLDDPRYPALARVATEGAVAAMTARTRSARPSSAEAYASISAGARVFVPRATSVAAFDADESLEGGTAAEATARRTGRPVSGAVVVPTAPVIRRDAGEHLSTLPGALAEALALDGRATAVVANADMRPGSGPAVRVVPAALAVMDSAGTVAAGTVDSSELLVEDEAEPFGLRADVGAFTAAVGQALEQADFVVVDLGDSERALAYAEVSTPEAAEAALARALGRTDDFLGRLLDPRSALVDERTLVFVAGVRAEAGLELPPLLAWGNGTNAGTLHSPSTKRAGLVTITDLGPTVLDALGADAVPGMIGAPLRLRDEAPDLGGMRRLDRLAAGREDVYYPMVVSMLAVQALGLAALAAAFPALRRRGPALARFAALTVAAWPFATFVERGVPGIERAGGGRHAVVWALAALAAAVALRATPLVHRRAQPSPLTPLALVAGATVLLLVGDVAAGAPLQQASVLGYTPHAAARYTGFGNVAFAVLAACATIAVATLADTIARRQRALAVGVSMLTVVIVADAWPTLGADVGGVLAMVPAFALLITQLQGRRPSWRLVTLAAAATILAVAVIAAVDLARPAESRSHLGQVLTSSRGDDGTLITTIARKASVNVELFGSTVWTWMLPIAAGFAAWAIWLRPRQPGGAPSILAPGSPRRAGLVALVVVGVLGGLVNDSGVVVTGAVFLFIGPYLAMLALGANESALP